MTNANADKSAGPSLNPLEFFWGDVAWWLGLIRVALKLLIALVAAWLVHEFVLAARLKVEVADIKSLIDIVAVQSERVKADSPPKNDKYDSVGFCVLSTEEVVGTCPSDTSAPDPLKEKDVVGGLGYSVLGYGTGADPLRLTSGAFFRVKKHFNLISEGHIEESIDTLLRRLELALFNGPAANDVKLCAGTRTLLNGKQCAFSGSVGQALGAESAQLRLAATAPEAPGKAKPKTLTQLIGDLRVSSMFVGPIQFGTLVIFSYALLETLGLWLRWVAPRDRLDLDVVQKDREKVLEELGKARVISIRDRLAVATMKNAKPPEPQPAAPPPPGAQPPVEEKPRPSVEVLSSYRDFLHEEAGGRQDALEMLGDTMLKLAFLGTVYGISSALFSARGLDTADPILRLATKATMYAGIGLGFGTTILGIACSIVAALFRSSLSAGWSREIGAAYQSVLKNLPNLPAIPNDSPREDSFRIPPLALLGLLILLGAGLFVAYSYRDTLGAMISVALDSLGNKNG